MKNSQKGFIVPLFIIIIAVLAIGGVYYVSTKSIVKTSTDVQTTEQSKNSDTIQSNNTIDTNSNSDNKQAINVNTKTDVSVNTKVDAELSATPYTFAGTPNAKYKGFTMNFPKGWTVKETISQGGDAYFEVKVTHPSTKGLVGQITIYQSTFPNQWVQPGKTPAKTFDEYVQTSDLKNKIQHL